MPESVRFVLLCLWLKIDHRYLILLNLLRGGFEQHKLVVRLDGFEIDGARDLNQDGLVSVHLHGHLEPLKLHVCELFLVNRSHNEELGNGLIGNVTRDRQLDAISDHMQLAFASALQRLPKLMAQWNYAELVRLVCAFRATEEHTRRRVLLQRERTRGVFFLSLQAVHGKHDGASLKGVGESIALGGLIIWVILVELNFVLGCTIIVDKLVHLEVFQWYIHRDSPEWINPRHPRGPIVVDILDLVLLIAAFRGFLWLDDVLRFEPQVCNGETTCVVSIFRVCDCRCGLRTGHAFGGD